MSIYFNLSFLFFFLFHSDDQIEGRQDFQQISNVNQNPIPNYSNSTITASDITNSGATVTNYSQSPPPPPPVISPPLSCPGSPILPCRKYIPNPKVIAVPAVWHGIKGSNMKRHMHVNFLIDALPTPPSVTTINTINNSIENDCWVSNTNITRSPYGSCHSSPIGSPRYSTQQ